MTAAAEPRWLTPGEQAAWRAYLEMSAKLTALLNREIVEKAGISLPDFAVLAQLSEHDDGSMRILELARALGWEKSRLSHQLTRMQQRGLIERRSCTDDRRGSFVALLDEGRRTIDLAAPRHVESVRTYLFDVLDASQTAALEALASAVVARIDESGADLGCPGSACGE